MADQLCAVVVGAGWAGEGHTKALQWCGVEVAAICARQADVVRAVADRLGVGEASTDWRATIERIRPDIVTLATPGILRLPVVDVASALGCHVLCEKPLALDATDAEAMYRLVEAAGVRHAFAATQRYGPEIAWLAELVRERRVGALREIMGTFWDGWARGGNGPSPWTWMADWRSGGGRLANGFPHDLAILATIIGGPPLRAMGRATLVRRELPVLPGMHDFRQFRRSAQALTADEANSMPHRIAESERDVAAILEFAGLDGPLPVTLHIGGAALPGDMDGWRLHGDEGTLLARRENGRFSYTVSIVRGGAEEPLPVPQRLLDDLPRVGDDEQNKWCALARDFVADIRDQAHRPYLTFRDGWRTQVAADAIRAGAGWTALPA